MRTVSSTGPIPVDEFRKIVEAPYGHAAKAIRKYDPLWGRITGEPIKWRVRLSRQNTEYGSATVEASTQEEADKLAQALPSSQVSWGEDFAYSDDEGEVESIEPIA